MLGWAMFLGLVIIFASARIALVQKWQWRRWVANLTIGLLPPILALAWAFASYVQMSGAEAEAAGMAMLMYPLAVIVATVGSVAALAVAAFVEHVG